MSTKVFQKEREFTCFVGGIEKKYKIIPPNFTQGNKASLIYKKYFTSAIREGVPSSAQLREEVTNPFYDKVSARIKELDVDIIKNTIELDNCETKDVGLPIVFKLKELRANRLVEGMKNNALYEGSADVYAEGVQNQYYLSELLVDENGKRVYSSFEDFLARQTDELAQTRFDADYVDGS